MTKILLSSNLEPFLTWRSTATFSTLEDLSPTTSTLTAFKTSEDITIKLETDTGSDLELDVMESFTISFNGMETSMLLDNSIIAVEFPELVELRTGTHPQVLTNFNGILSKLDSQESLLLEASDLSQWNLSVDLSMSEETLEQAMLQHLSELVQLLDSLDGMELTGTMFMQDASMDVTSPNSKHLSNQQLLRNLIQPSEVQDLLLL